MRTARGQLQWFYVTTGVLGSGLRRKWDPKENGRFTVYALFEEHEIIDCQMKKATSCPLSPTC